MGPISAVHELSSREKFLAELGIEPGAAGWESQKLPLCHAAPRKWHNFKQFWCFKHWPCNPGAEVIELGILQSFIFDQILLPTIFIEWAAVEVKLLAQLAHDQEVLGSVHDTPKIKFWFSDLAPSERRLEEKIAFTLLL